MSDLDGPCTTDKIESLFTSLLGLPVEEIESFLLALSGFVTHL